MEAQQDLDREGGERGRVDKERKEVIEVRRQEFHFVLHFALILH